MEILLILIAIIFLAYGFHKGFSAELEIDIEAENMRNLYGDNTK